MMGALSKSLRVDSVLAYTEADDIKGNVELDGYAPNPVPLLEVGGWYRCADFLRKQSDKVLIKVFFDALPEIPAGKHTIIFMDRDPEEIKESLRRVQAHFDKIGYEDKMKASPDRTFDVFAPYSQEDIEHVIGIMEMREDVELIRVSYNDLMADPHREFQRISEMIPLDVNEAASYIDSNYYRSKVKDDYSSIRDEKRSANG